MQQQGPGGAQDQDEREILDQSPHRKIIADPAVIRCGSVFFLARKSVSLATALLLCCVPGAPRAQPSPELATPRTEKQVVEARRFMVVAAHPLAARAGYDVLKLGGTAVDAAIAVELMLNLVEPQSSGIGGGGFLLHYAARGDKLETYCTEVVNLARANQTLAAFHARRKEDVASGKRPTVRQSLDRLSS